jgi:putative ABC transport system permease protein
MGFVDDMIGQQGYIVKNDLHRWLDEEPAVNTINLKIDPDYLERLYVTLNARPEVANVGIRKLLLESFSSTVADMILTFTFILYFFAVAIAGAVMYNSARIGFSERAWEMASLRILGYPAKTSFELLFVDIGFQVLLALVPGIALGYYFSYLSTRFIHNDTFKFPLVIDLATYGAAVIVLLVTFFASGVFLYRRANRLDLSEALKARE